MTGLPETHRQRRHGRSRSRAREPRASDANSAIKAALGSHRRPMRSYDAATRSLVRPLNWEGWLAVFALLHGARAFRFLFEAGGADTPVSTGVWLLLYLAVFVLLWHHHRLRWLIWLLRHQPLLCAVLAVAAASWFWSIAPEFTWKRVVHLLGTTMTAVFIGYHFAPRTLMSVLFYTFTILIVGSIGFALVLPEIGQANYGGSTVWEGVTSNKNWLGFVAAITIVYMIVTTLFERIPITLGLGLALASIVCLAMTDSATSIVALAVGILTIIVFTVSKRIRAPSILTLLLLLFGGGVAAYVIATTDYVYDFTEMLGRDATFTSRTELWAAAWQATLDRPWLGWGYGTLWTTSADSAFVQQQLMDTPWIANHAHNGFLTTASELGIPAGIAAVGCLLTALIQATDRYVAQTSHFNLFAIVFLCMFLVENVTETWLFMNRDPFWMLFVTIAVAVHRRTVSHHRSMRLARSSSGGRQGKEIRP